MLDKIKETGGDLLKDLRDRRLLPVAIALLVAIFAVPILLGGGGEEVPSPTPIALGAEDAEELEAVVLAGSSGVREYRKRLAGAPRNPFKHRYPGMGRDGGDAEAKDEDAEAGGTSPLGSPSQDGGATDVPVPGQPGVEPVVPQPKPPERVTRVFRMKIDVRVWHNGKKREIRGIEPLSFVPGMKSPVVQFTGATHDVKKASFVLSPAVVRTWGDGNCDPGRNDCQFLTMKPGESQYFHYGEKAKRYRIKLLAIERELIKREKVAGGGKDRGKASEIG